VLAVDKLGATARLTKTPDGGIGVAEGGDDGLISGNKELLFLFPRSDPATVVKVELSDFELGESVSMEYSHDLAAKESRKRLSMSLILTNVVEDTSEVITTGYTMYRFKPIGDTSFGVKSLTLSSNEPALMVIDLTPTAESFPFWMIIVMAVGGCLYCLCVIGLIIFVVKRNKNDDDIQARSTPLPMDQNSSSLPNSAVYNNIPRASEASYGDLQLSPGGSEASHYARPDVNAQVGAYAPSDNVNVGGYSGTYQALDYVQSAAYNDLQPVHGQNQFGQPQFGTYTSANTDDPNRMPVYSDGAGEMYQPLSYHQ